MELTHTYGMPVLRKENYCNSAQILFSKELEVSKSDCRGGSKANVFHKLSKNYLLFTPPVNAQ